MNDVIKLNQIKLMAICGAQPEEQELSQPFSINLSVEADLSLSGSTDNLNDTIDYGSLCDAIEKLARVEKFMLLERFAQRIIEEISKCDSRIEAIAVSIKKLKPPVKINLESSEVKIYRKCK